MENLILKVPEFLFENKDIRAFFDAVEPELVLLGERRAQLAKNIFPETADRDGIRHYEEWLGIPYNRTLSLDDRRIEVLARLNETLPFTEIRLQRFLAGAVGWDHFKYERDGAHITVTLDTEGGSGAESIKKMLHRVVPLNCHFDVVITHSKEDDELLYGIGSWITEIIETESLDDNLQTARVYTPNAVIVTEIIET